MALACWYRILGSGDEGSREPLKALSLGAHFGEQWVPVARQMADFEHLPEDPVCIAPAATANSPTRGRVKFPHRGDGTGGL